MPEVLSITPLSGYTDATESPSLTVMAGDYGEALRVQVGPLLHRFTLSLAMTNAERAVVDEFFEDRVLDVGSFYWMVPATHTRTGVALGTGNGSNQSFPLPSSGAEQRDYPIEDATAVLKVNGTPVSATVDTDTRTFTAAVAPGLGTAVTADYTFYRLVRLEGGIEWTVVPANYDWNETGLVLVEVVGE